MAKKKQSAEGVLVAAAKTIGAAVGRVVSEVGVHPQTKSGKVPKLAKKNKARLPRREKKALQKAGQL
jgi:hypothetical protein